MTRRYAIDALHGFITEAMESCELPPDDAKVVSDRMLDADVRGMSGHGIFRLPAYIHRLQEGGVNPRPAVRTVYETPVSALIDGSNGMGQVVVTRAVRTAVAKADQHGLAWVGVRGSNHAGAAGVYASIALERDLVGLYMAVGNANHLPPWGGTDMLMSTNPVAVAIPAGAEPPVVLDMATTVASYGRIKIAAERGERIPEGWMVDRQGAPLTDPTRATEGFLLPIGGYKGYGMGLVIGMLAGVLNGAAFGSQVVDFNVDASTPTNTGQTIIVVRPDLLRPLDEFKAEMDERIKEIRQSTPMEGHPPVRLPGDATPHREAEMRSRGVPIGDETVERLVNLAGRIGLEHPFQS